MNEYGCELASLVNEKNTASEQNTTLSEQTLNRFDEILNKIEQDNVYKNYIIFNIISTIDPFIEYPCEFTATDSCRHYINKDTYKCLYSSSTGFLPEKDYRPVSITTSILNILLFFIEGYLISSVIIFLYRKIRKTTTY